MQLFKRLVFVSVVFVFSTAIIAQTRQIAVTIDDLPVVSTRKDIATRRTITRSLLDGIKKQNIPAIGFVNENKLHTDDKRDEAQVDLLRMWLDAGLELGNHTFSHMSLHDNPLDVFESDILKGEIITKEIMADRGLKPRYFRHPFLWTGLSLDIKRDLCEFLQKHGYTIAPVTVDNADYIFARAYDNAFDKGDKAMLKKIGEAYVPYMESKIEYWERQSQKTLGREISQVLLMHANRINSVYVGDLAKMMKKRGYKFVSLEEALKDEAYQLPDTFIKRNGISWLHRWALAKGKDTIVGDEPRVPEFV
ncbi:MAG TPA: polysaccharide deacetylase family protein, partial [Pyrinomonadaceae bacterium]|nr:polysaccharide deacetylase family protein [Pyrinomonadaceae bacterium]